MMKYETNRDNPFFPSSFTLHHSFQIPLFARHSNTAPTA